METSGFHGNLAIFCRVEALVYIKVLPVGKSQTKYHIPIHILVWFKVLPAGSTLTKYHILMCASLTGDLTKRYIKVHGVFCTYIVHT